MQRLRNLERLQHCLGNYLLEVAQHDQQTYLRLEPKNIRLLEGQQASTSPFPVAWQFDVEGQQDPLPQDLVLAGHVPDCSDQPWPATARGCRGGTAVERAEDTRVPKITKERSAPMMPRER